MKRTTIAAALITTLAAPAFAQDTGGPLTPEACRQTGENAAEIMRHRQYGTPMSDLMTPETLASKALVLAVTRAYEEPRWHTESSQERAIADFREKYERHCFSGLLRQMREADTEAKAPDEDGTATN